MEKSKQYICTKSWARNKEGDIIERWLFNKYPPEIQQDNFKPYSAPTPKVKPNPAVNPGA